MTKIYAAFLVVAMLLTNSVLHSQVVLTNTSYYQSFDGLGNGLPFGWTVRTGATSSNLGNEVSLNATPIAWNHTSGAFKNFASADGLTSSATTATQAGSTDRSLGVRQTSSVGDPGAAFVLRIANTIGKTGFNMGFKLQSLDVNTNRKVIWTVDYGVGDAPSTFIATSTNIVLATGDNKFLNDSITVNFGSSLNNIAENVWIRIVALNGSSNSGSRPSTGIDDVTLQYSQGGSDVIPPAVSRLSPMNGDTAVQYSTNVASITFDEAIKKNTGFITIRRATDSSVVQSLNVTAANVSVSNNIVTFPIALMPNTGYFVQVDSAAFVDEAGNAFAGLKDTTTWQFKTSFVFLSATFDVCSNQLSHGFTQFSVQGAQEWGCTSFGRDASSPPTGSAPSGVQINGFASGSNVPNEDWLISPPLDFTAFTFPLLSFYSRSAFNGDPLQLKISTDYNGGDPSTATWTNFNGQFPTPGSDVWTLTSQLNLSAFKQPNIHFAFVYTSSSTSGSRWTIDDISVENSPVPPAPMIFVNPGSVQFGFTAAGNSMIDSIVLTVDNAQNEVTLNTTGNFQLSLNKQQFANTGSIAADSANGVSRLIYIRFLPNVADQNYSGTLVINTNGASKTVVLSGTSIDPTKTLEVVNWNIEWFGSPGINPANDSLQQENVRKVMESVGADIYGLSEIVDTARLGAVARSLTGGYSYTVSDYGSHTNTAKPNPSPLGEAQKLAFVYKNNMFSNVTTTALLSTGINTASDTATTNYNNWSSGRFPYMMSADVTLNGVTKNIKFILIHGKANTSPILTSYERRKAGADSLHQLLNTTYANDNIIVLGDFNDDLDQTITSGINPPVTSYNSFVNDNGNYQAVTLPLSLAGNKSTVSYNDMIDHVVISNEMRTYYMDSSATVVTGAAALISNYANTTSDHYPIFTRYAFSENLLPLDVVSFSAKKESNSTLLSWNCAGNTQAKEFVIERSSGSAYMPIATVAAQATFRSQNYLYTDKKPNKGVNHYRIRQVDMNGKITFTKTVTLTFLTDFSFLPSPNPATSKVNIKIQNLDGRATLELYDMQGRKIKALAVPANASLVELSLADVTKGLYTLIIHTDNESLAKRLVIQ